MSRRVLSDREWTRLEPLLPKRRTGRPPKGHRTIIDALRWLGKTGAPWRDLPERFGPWRTVATRFYRNRCLRATARDPCQLNESGMRSWRQRAERAGSLSRLFIESRRSCCSDVVAGPGKV